MKATRSTSFLLLPLQQIPPITVRILVTQTSSRSLETCRAPGRESLKVCFFLFPQRNQGGLCNHKGQTEGFIYNRLSSHGFCFLSLEDLGRITTSMAQNRPSKAIVGTTGAFLHCCFYSFFSIFFWYFRTIATSDILPPAETPQSNPLPIQASSQNIQAPLKTGFKNDKHASYGSKPLYNLP